MIPALHTAFLLLAYDPCSLNCLPSYIIWSLLSILPLCFYYMIPALWTASLLISYDPCSLYCLPASIIWSLLFIVASFFNPMIPSLHTDCSPASIRWSLFFILQPCCSLTLPAARVFSLLFIFSICCSFLEHPSRIWCEHHGSAPPPPCDDVTGVTHIIAQHLEDRGTNFVRGPAQGCSQHSTCRGPKWEDSKKA